MFSVVACLFLSSLLIINTEARIQFTQTPVRPIVQINHTIGWSREVSDPSRFLLQRVIVGVRPSAADVQLVEAENESATTGTFQVSFPSVATYRLHALEFSDGGDGENRTVLAESSQFDVIQSPEDGVTTTGSLTSEVSQPTQSDPPSSIESNGPKKKSSAGLIAGVVVGVVGGLAVLVCLFLIYRRKKSRSTLEESPVTKETSTTSSDHQALHPFPLASPLSSSALVPEKQAALFTASVASEPTGTAVSTSLPSDREYPTSLLTSHTGTTEESRQAFLQSQSDRTDARIQLLERAVANSNAEAQETREELQRLREENDWMRQQQQSDWAHGRTDIPPPYVPSRV